MSRSLKEMGEDISADTLATHRSHYAISASPPSEEMDTAVAELKQEAGRVPATLRAPYFVLIHFLQNLGSQEVKPADAIRAAVAISQISGNKTKQQFLLDFAEAAWAPEGSMWKQTTEVEAPPVPSELLPLLEGLDG